MNRVMDERMAAIFQEVTGLTVEEARRKPLEEIHATIEAKIGRPLGYRYLPSLSFSPSGDDSVLIDAGRIITPEDLNR